MLGAIVGDIVGSRFEFANSSIDDTVPEFGMPVEPGYEFLSEECFFTDDTILTLAVCQALVDTDGKAAELPQLAVKRLCEFANRYPNAGYGDRFQSWVRCGELSPYYSLGNGSAMRVSGCAYAADTLEEVLILADCVTMVTHNHPEGLKGAEAVTAATFLARKGHSKEEIRRFITDRYYQLDFTLDSIRPDYWRRKGLGTCAHSVPQALEAFFEADDFESAVRMAVGLGGDTDTLAAIAGAPAAAYYGIPDKIAQKTRTYLKDDLLATLEIFEARFA